MNTEIGHLINMNSQLAKEKFGNDIDLLKNALNQGYQPVPADLKEAATRKLNGQDEAFVSKTSGGKLSRWAAKQRKAKRKVTKEAKRRNR